LSIAVQCSCISWSLDLRSKNLLDAAPGVNIQDPRAF
jgi:hypothetical protein